MANIARHDRDHGRLAVDDEGRRRAAVAIVLVDSAPGADHVEQPPSVVAQLEPDDRRHGDAANMAQVSGGPAFLLIRRTARMSSHAGQWGLPGGGLDPGESAIDAARRELHEELGVDLGADGVLGVLDDYPTRSGYVITPVVMWGGGRLELRPEPAEVWAAYRIGLDQLTREDSPRFLRIPETDRPVVQLPLGDVVVHAPTGAVLFQFRTVALEGRAGERVDHLDQPVFAWR